MKGISTLWILACLASVTVAQYGGYGRGLRRSYGGYGGYGGGDFGAINRPFAVKSPSVAASDNSYGNAGGYGGNNYVGGYGGNAYRGDYGGGYGGVPAQAAGGNYGSGGGYGDFSAINRPYAVGGYGSTSNHKPIYDTYTGASDYELSINNLYNSMMGLSSRIRNLIPNLRLKFLPPASHTLMKNNRIYLDKSRPDAVVATVNNSNNPTTVIRTPPGPTHNYGQQQQQQY